MLLFLFFLFFFQAEDGIRDLVRSRGLGDVYKRQPLPSVDVWIFNGPPGYTAAANDCEARSTNSGDSKYGAYWQASTTDNIKGRGLLAYCSSKLNLACCH